ncbi:hypothetical protein AM592_20610 [Bacillus gobiensis]|uniref:KANL3/Tex30 alpha/beta hydrolase-like domain-containing protein n=1 Tax=Bacillus gobiensis TaxID=1441095 RepID=A0A0M4FNS4_9BACI|nr:hypothetical protein AM592_20610 [Bacillus gobiensis]
MLDKTVNGYNGLPVQIAHFKQRAADTLAILLPGLGYTNQAPLLYYSLRVFLNRGYDVLQINYNYQSNSYKALSNEEFDSSLKFDVKATVDEVLESNVYQSFYLTGKSLGTIGLASELAHREQFQSAKAIWLTPLITREEVFQAMAHGKNKGMQFIGDHDPYYVKERFHKILENKNISSKLIEGADHSLEDAGNLQRSMRLLNEIIKDIEGFLDLQ